jgi:hypothetical protein
LSKCEEEDLFKPDNTPVSEAAHCNRWRVTPRVSLLSAGVSAKFDRELSVATDKVLIDGSNSLQKLELNDDLSSIELRQTKSAEWLVVAGLLFLEDTDCDLFSKFQGLGRIRAPVNACRVAA